MAAGEDPIPEDLCPANPPTYNAEISSVEKYGRYAAKVSGLVYGITNDSPRQFLEMFLASNPVPWGISSRPWILETIEHSATLFGSSLLHYSRIATGGAIQSALFLKTIAGLAVVGSGYYVYTHWDSKSGWRENMSILTAAISNDFSWLYGKTGGVISAVTGSILAVGYDFASSFLYAKASMAIHKQGLAAHRKFYQYSICGPYKNYCMLALMTAEILMSAPVIQAGMEFSNEMVEIDAGFYLGIRGFNGAQLKRMEMCEAPRLFHDMGEYMAEKYDNNTIGLFAEL